MNFYKVIQAQAKSMKLTWSTTRGGGAGRVQFAGANKCSAEIEDLNYIMANVVAKVKKKKRVKDMATHESGLEDEM